MDIDSKLVNHFIKATEHAAYGASLYVGKKDKIAADQSAVDQMRNQLNLINMKGKIVIGEGEMDEAPMLYINEKVGTNKGDELDIAVDPLEGTNFVANNLPNALAVLAVTKKGNLLHAPDMYMEKIAVGPGLPKNIIDLDFPIEKNIQLLCKAKKTKTEKLTACVLERKRHDAIIKSLKSLGVKIHFISDGDVSGTTLHQNGIRQHATRLKEEEVEVWKPTVKDLTAFAGRYFSEEIETFYMAVVEDGQLVMHQRRLDVGNLTSSDKDVFTSDGGMTFSFERDRNKQVIAFYLSNGRTRDVRFERIR